MVFKKIPTKYKSLRRWLTYARLAGAQDWSRQASAPQEPRSRGRRAGFIFQSGGSGRGLGRGCGPEPDQAHLSDRGLDRAKGRGFGALDRARVTAGNSPPRPFLSSYLFVQVLKKKNNIIISGRAFEHACYLVTLLPALLGGCARGLFLLVFCLLLLPRFFFVSDWAGVRGDSTLVEILALAG
jgi:hypothetical protein